MMLQRPPMFAYLVSIHFHGLDVGSLQGAASELETLFKRDVALRYLTLRSFILTTPNQSYPVFYDPILPNRQPGTLGLRTTFSSFIQPRTILPIPSANTNLTAPHGWPIRAGVEVS